MTPHGQKAPRLFGRPWGDPTGRYTLSRPIHRRVEPESENRQHLFTGSRLWLDFRRAVTLRVVEAPLTPPFPRRRHPSRRRGRCIPRHALSCVPVARRWGVIRHDPEIQALYRRYCLPARRYLKLGGAILRMPREQYEPFVHDLAADAKAVTDAELTILFEGSWRERRTAAWLAAVSRRDHFRERLGALLLESEVCCAGGAYCVALASFGTARDVDLLAAYLDRYLRRPALAYDQPTAMGALAYTDSALHGDRARCLLQEGGLWRQWFQDAPHMHGDDGISTYMGGIRLACAVIDEWADT